MRVILAPAGRVTSAIIGVLYLRKLRVLNNGVQTKVVFQDKHPAQLRPGSDLLSVSAADFCARFFVVWAGMGA